jgi:hypothetical protein
MPEPPSLDVTPPDPNMPEGKAKIAAAEEYFKAIGKVVYLFAGVEAALFALFGTLSGAPPEMLRAFFSDMRVAPGMSNINRAQKARREARKFEGKKAAFEDEMQAIINDIFGQLGVINGMRNLLVHYATMEPGGEAPLVSNWTRALDRDQLKEVRMPLSDLAKMACDLQTAIYCLMIVRARFLKWEEPVPTDLQQILDKRTWLYKSPLQGETKDKSRSTPPKQ